MTINDQSMLILLLTTYALRIFLLLGHHELDLPNAFPNLVSGWIFLAQIEPNFWGVLVSVSVLFLFHSSSCPRAFWFLGKGREEMIIKWPALLYDISNHKPQVAKNGTFLGQFLSFLKVHLLYLLGVYPLSSNHSLQDYKKCGTSPVL